MVSGRWAEATGGRDVGISSGSGPIGRTRVCLERPLPRGDTGGMVEYSSDRLHAGAENENEEQEIIEAGILGWAVK